ncbi:efflux RND transporter periplasmic adaptor subunit [Loktanella sp. R86503]|uniref:efflux RND transporter periplasmic adaptor subunit n=1 Tax=Loktanella sp. R86503 TaxID=3093847 RepID=UPI0036DB904B
MRRILSVILAVAVLFAIYSAAFGMPERIASLVNVTPAQTDDAAGGPTAAGGSAGGPGGAGPGGGGPGGGGRPGGGNRTTTVVTTPLELQPYEVVLNALGTATALRSADVVADAAGEVTQVNLSANKTVAAGDVLVQLDARTQTLDLEIAQAQLDQANETVARYDRLRASGNSTVTDVTLSDARIAQRLAQANVGLAQVALDDRTLRAPIAGKLGLSDVEVGDQLSANEVVVTIDDDEALLVEFELPERAIGVLQDVKTVFASTPSLTGRNFEGEVVSFDSRLDDVTRSVTVKARIDNASKELWPGMTFAVRIMQETDPLPAIASTAITWSRTGSSIWVDADGSAEQVPVTILYRRDNIVWIDADIPAGTAIVTEGAQKLREGAAITTPDAVRRGPRGGAPAEGGARVGADASAQTAPAGDPT